MRVSRVGPSAKPRQGGEAMKGTRSKSKLRAVWFFINGYLEFEGLEVVPASGADGVDDFVVGHGELDDVGVIMQVGVFFIWHDAKMHGCQGFGQQLEADGRALSDNFHEPVNFCGVVFAIHGELVFKGQAISNILRRNTAK